MFVSVSAVSLCSQKAGAELCTCLLAQVYYVFHVQVSEVRECGELCLLVLALTVMAVHLCVDSAWIRAGWGVNTRLTGEAE